MELKCKILQNVKPDDKGCWLWQLSVYQGTGYGQLHVRPKKLLAHRVSYEVFVGAIPKDKCVLHKCDVRRCCNPEHLFLGSKRDNIQDAIQKGRHWVPTGESCKQSKLTVDEVLDIRRRYSDGEKQIDIAPCFGVCPQQVSSIVRRKKWKQI